MFSGEVAELQRAIGDHVLVAVADSQGVLSYVNDRLCARTGRSREELVGQDLSTLASDGQDERFLAQIAPRLRPGGKWRGSLVGRSPDGSNFWIEATLTPVRLGPSGDYHLLVVGTDVTDFQRAQAAAARLAAIVESSDDAIVGKDLQGIVTSWNRGAEKVFGYSESEMIGRPIMVIIPPDRRQEEIDILSKISLGQSVRHFDTVRVRKDGSLINVSVTVSAIRGPDGRIVGASKVARDTTEQRRAEDLIKELNLGLEQRIADRTAELQEANRQLEAFSYSVSHDLRAPLRAIDGFSQAVIEDFAKELPEDGRRYLATISASARRMGTLIDDLLAFARLGRHELRRQPIDTASLVKACLEELGQPWTERKLHLRVEPLSPCVGDHALLKQVWLNVLSNALKYTRRREEASIEVTQERDGDVVTFCVRDNGVGFDDRYAQKLFGVFQRFHRAEDYEGTGVGLAIAERIITRHGGRIWAKSKPNTGAAFFFTLPIAPLP